MQIYPPTPKGLDTNYVGLWSNLNTEIAIKHKLLIPILVDLFIAVGTSRAIQVQ